MNLAVISSLLVQSNWIFLAGWLLLLVTAFGLCFKIHPQTASSQQLYPPPLACTRRW